jgi:hypothetical protein
MRRLFFLLILSTVFYSCKAQQLPSILSDTQVQKAHYLPDFSYAGYMHGENVIPSVQGTIIKTTDYGVIANDGLDDSKALIKAMAAASTVQGNVIVELPAGRVILSDIIYIERSNLVLIGAGTGDAGTELYFPRPLIYEPTPQPLKELQEYLIEFDKNQREKVNNIDLPFSPYSWAGGFIWTQVHGERVKSYLATYDQPAKVIADGITGNRGDLFFKAKNNNGLKVGEVVELQLFNKDGEQGIIIDDLYKKADVKIGGHHWNFPDLPLVRQQVRITKIKGNTIYISSPLTIDVKPEYEAQLTEWKHLEQVGIQDFKITFPMSPRVAHHVEQGWNGIFLTRLYDSWVQNVVIENSDSAILTEEIANVTIKNITTTGEHIGHYSVAMSGVYNVLAENIVIKSKIEHPLSFNTLSTKSVYRNCEVFINPILDQHSGANHQNLFDDITVHIDNENITSYGLFKGGGAGYWKPSHGAYSTFWNINVLLKTLNGSKNIFTLDGMSDGPLGRVIGVYGNREFEINYGPDAFIDLINDKMIETPSLYDYQLEQRMKK